MHHREQTRHPRMAVKPAAGTDFGDLYTPPGSIAAVGDGCGAAHDVLGARWCLMTTKTSFDYLSSLRRQRQLARLAAENCTHEGIFI